MIVIMIIVKNPQLYIILPLAKTTKNRTEET